MGLIIKSNIRKTVRGLQRIPKNSQSSVKDVERDKENEITSVADEVEMEMEKKAEEILSQGIKRAKQNGRRTLQARDL